MLSTTPAQLRSCTRREISHLWQLARERARPLEN